jgi:hypothetical protein
MGFLRGFLKEHDNTAHLFQYYKEGDTPSFPNLNLGAVPAAFLDAGGLINASFLPVSAMQFKGEWNASTNTPTLADGAGTDGDVYIVTTAGSRDLGSGTIDFYVNDWVMYNGAVWIKAANTNIFNDLEVKGELDWSGGNVVYVPLEKTGKTQTEILTEAITAATSGDTLQLAAGTYTITSMLTVNKKLHIRGMGRGITTIACSTANVNMLSLSTEAGTLFSDLTIAQSSVKNSGSLAATIWSTVSCNLVNVDFADTTTGTSAARCYVGVYLSASAASAVNLWNCRYVGSGAAGCHVFVAIAGTNPTANIYNCCGTSVGGTSTDIGNSLLYTNSATGVMNVFGGDYASSTDTATGVFTTLDGALNVYEGTTINGSGATAFDVKNAAGTLTLYNTTLVNNKTSGTITYGGTTVTDNTKVDGAIEWIGGRTWYVPVGGDIATYITNATAGDTLQLAAGTYTITAELAGSKRLHYRGMGRGITKITTSTDLVSDPMINISPDGSGSLISDMDIEWTGEITGAGSQMIKVRGNLNVNNVHIYNLATSTNARYPAGFRFASATAYTLNVVNSFYTATGAKGWGALATISGYNGTMNFYNVHATSADGSSVNGANILYCDKTGGTINVYGGSYITATDKASAAVECNAGTINVYNGAVISGSGATAFDVKRNAGTITLYAGTNLVNNKTSGTITYAGTVASSQINLGGTSLNKTQLDALLALLEE